MPKKLIIPIFIILISLVSLLVLAASRPSFEICPAGNCMPQIGTIQPLFTVNHSTDVQPPFFNPGNQMRLSVSAIDPSGVAHVKATIKDPANNTVITMNLYDNGATSSGDDQTGGANDNVFTGVWYIPFTVTTIGNYTVFLEAADTLDNTYTSTGPENIYSSGIPVPFFDIDITCIDECFNVGDERCHPTLHWTQLCSLGTDGCRDWVNQTNCGTNICCPNIPANTASCCSFGETCSVGMCSSTCVDDCAIGNTRCNGTIIQDCGYYDSDPCLDYGNTATDCANSGQICAAGACALPACVDNDGDGYGTGNTSQCAAPEPDCDDNKAMVHPGAVEVCDGLDSNCNGQVDEDCDRDNDNYCSCAKTFVFGSDLRAVCFGTNTTNAASIANTCDCNDDVNLVSPGQREACDNMDNNCNLQTDEGCDDDNDDYCDATMRFYNYPNNVCAQTNVPDGHLGDDCDDTTNTISPIDSEVCDNSSDDDCDQRIDCSDSDCAGTAICSIACVPDGCNDTCPIGCLINEDPDCSVTGCCGDSLCNIGECDSGCVADCQPSDCCMDGICQSIMGEDSTTCPVDCQVSTVLSATITNPSDGDKFAQDQTIFFQGIASGGTPGYTYTWSSDVDGVLGAGANISIP